jgi:hypothetical protein
MLLGRHVSATSRPSSGLALCIYYLCEWRHCSGCLIVSTHINNKYIRARPDDGPLVAETCRPNNMYVDLALKLFGAQQIKTNIAVFILTATTE